MYTKNLLKILILTLTLLILGVGCKGIAENTVSNKDDVLKTAWNDLSESEKNEIIGDWQDGKVEKITIKENSTIFLLEDKTFEGKEVYLVTFKSEKEDIRGNVQVLVGIKNHKVVGRGFRE